MSKLYKILGVDGWPINGGRGRWHLPADGDEWGEWMPPVEGELVPCRNGYHLCESKDLLEWLGPCIHPAEYRGDEYVCADKIVAREARVGWGISAWNERTARLFACDCAERVLYIYEQVHPGDGRPRQAIEVARAFARGEASYDELTATWDTARAMALAAARNAEAASDAAWAVAWAAARVVAWPVANDTAKAAAWAAARSAAWAARNAAKAAARAMAWAAAKAAGAAAWAATRKAEAANDAAWAAAEAAGAAERQWQTARLLKILED